MKHHVRDTILSFAPALAVLAFLGLFVVYVTVLDLDATSSFVPKKPGAERPAVHDGAVAPPDSADTSSLRAPGWRDGARWHRRSNAATSVA